jgi:hypothetical protein
MGHESPARTDRPDSVNVAPMYERYDSSIRIVDYRRLYACLEIMTATSYLDQTWCAEFAAAMGHRVTESGADPTKALS